MAMNISSFDYYDSFYMPLIRHGISTHALILPFENMGALNSHTKCIFVKIAVINLLFFLSSILIYIIHTLWLLTSGT